MNLPKFGPNTVVTDVTVDVDGNMTIAEDTLSAAALDILNDVIRLFANAKPLDHIESLGPSQ